MKDLIAIHGRMGRLTYAKVTALALLPLTLGLVFVSFPMAMAVAAGAEAVPVGFSAIGGIALIFAALWAVAAASIRRLRDMGWSAWWLLACVVPVEAVALVAVIVLSLAMSFVPGRRGADGPVAV